MSDKEISAAAHYIGEVCSYMTFMYAIALGSTPRRIREPKMARQREDFPTLDLSPDKYNVNTSDAPLSV